MPEEGDTETDTARSATFSSNSTANSDLGLTTFAAVTMANIYPIHEEAGLLGPIVCRRPTAVAVGLQG